MKRKISLSVIAILGIAGLAVVWWLIAPLFIDQSVDEAFPLALPDEAEISELSPEEAEQTLDEAMEVIDEEFVESLPPEQAQELEEQIAAISTMMPDSEMEEEMPETETQAEWVLVSEGQFQDADSTHRGSGTASVFQQGETQILRFENFNVTNGPDLHVLLVENIGAGSHDELGDYIDLGKLKGNMGDQNYEIPDGIDISQYEGIIIYCVPFRVVFARAPLGQ